MKRKARESAEAFAVVGVLLVLVVCSSKNRAQQEEQ